MEVIKEIVDRYRMSTIQSEAEVGAKFVLPLLKALGFPEENCAQEFPVHAYKSKGVLRADFLLFSATEFADNRAKTKESIDWVANHSLLVVETKAPGKMPEMEDQPAEYALRTKSVAYIFTDGVVIRGYYIQPYREDSLLFECQVEDLWKCEDIYAFSYKALIRRKEELRVAFSPTGLVIRGVDPRESVEIVENSGLIHLSDEYIAGLKKAIGKEREELSKAQVLRMFLTRTNNILENDYRYDIPKYMMGVPRGEEQGELYISNDIFFLLKGLVTIFYRDNEDMLLFDAGFVQINLHLREGVVDGIYIQPKVYGSIVEERVRQYKTVMKLFLCLTLTLEYVYNGRKYRIVADKTKLKQNPQEFEESVSLLQAVLDYMSDLKQIEDYYSVHFDLSVFDRENYDLFHGDLEKSYYLKKAMLDEDNYVLGLQMKPFRGYREIEGCELMAYELPEDMRPSDICIYGCRFVPEKVLIANKRIKFVEKFRKTIEISACWKYAVANHTG